MLFNSLAFTIFLPIVFILYWFIINKNLKRQNILLLLSSYVFYGWWDWRFLALLFSISLINYFIGIRIEENETEKNKRNWLRLGLFLNIGTLCIFKYYNFFIDSFIDLISLTGYNLSRTTTKFILPLGISFYTFLSLSYIIDIFKGKLPVSRNIADVLLTLSFFPIILAGPIQRPLTLLPQITQKRKFEYDFTIDGLRQILWGLFAKIVIADNLAPKVNEIFTFQSSLPGSMLLVGAFMFAIQIYADFSGYSNMAIGIGKLFGFNLMQNFAYPYFARDIAEHWKRWHISLTTWFRDYIFLPLSFSISWKITKGRVFLIKTDLFIYIIASLITWFLTGLWHGANYTFILWGMIHGVFLIIHHWQKKPRKQLLGKFGMKNDNSFIIAIETVITLLIVLFAWIFFRADSLNAALSYISGIFSSSVLSKPVLDGKSMVLLVMIGIFLFVEWLGRAHQHSLFQLGGIKHTGIRWSFYFILITLIFIFSTREQEFIYFQF